MTEHTPTPWGRSLNLIHEPNYSTVTQRIGSTFNYRGNGAQNAAFIVKAVNSHDELVAALEKALPWVSPPLDDADMSASAVAHRAIKAALAKVSP